MNFSPSVIWSVPVSVRNFMDIFLFLHSHQLTNFYIISGNGEDFKDNSFKIGIAWFPENISVNLKCVTPARYRTVTAARERGVDQPDDELRRKAESGVKHWNTWPVPGGGHVLCLFLYSKSIFFCLISNKRNIEGRPGMRAAS